MVIRKKKITVIGTELAQKGVEFIFEGELSECDPCPLKKACHNLVPGRRYQVVNVRPARHECPVHLGGSCTIEATEAPVETVILSEKAVLNTRIEYEGNCLRYDCPNNNLCNAPGLEKGTKYLVVEVKGKTMYPCEKGLSVKSVIVAPIDFRDAK